MLISDIMGRHGLGVIALMPDTLVAGAALLLAEQSISAGVVIDPDGGMMGIISERDITRGLGRYGAAVADMKVSELMTEKIVSCELDSTVADALGLMQSMNVRHLPVIDADNHLIGMVSMRDLVAVQDTALRIAS